MTAAKKAWHFHFLPHSVCCPDKHAGQMDQPEPPPLEVHSSEGSIKDDVATEDACVSAEAFVVF